MALAPVEVGLGTASWLTTRMRRKEPLTWANTFQHLSAPDIVSGRHVPQMCPAADPTDEELIEFLIQCSG